MHGESIDCFLVRMNRWRGMGIKFLCRKFRGSRLVMADFEEVWNDMLLVLVRSYPALIPDDDPMFCGLVGWVRWALVIRAVSLMRWYRPRERRRVHWDDNWWSLYTVQPDVVLEGYIDFDRFILEVLPLLPPDARHTVHAMIELMTLGEYTAYRLGEKLKCSASHAYHRIRLVKLVLKQRGFSVDVADVPVRAPRHWKRLPGGRRISFRVDQPWSGSGALSDLRLRLGEPAEPAAAVTQVSSTGL